MLRKLADIVVDLHRRTCTPRRLVLLRILTVSGAVYMWVTVVRELLAR